MSSNRSICKKRKILGINFRSERYLDHGEVKKLIAFPPYDFSFLLIRVGRNFIGLTTVGSKLFVCSTESRLPPNKTQGKISTKNYVHTYSPELDFENA